MRTLVRLETRLPSVVPKVETVAEHLVPALIADAGEGIVTLILRRNSKGSESDRRQLMLLAERMSPVARRERLSSGSRDKWRLSIGVVADGSDRR